MQVIESRNTIASTTIVSSEIDFELPRGFVVKIHKVRVWAHDIMDKFADAEKDQVHFALLLDPDDAMTIRMPDNTVEHDVVLSGTIEYNVVAALTVALLQNHTFEWDFSHLEGLDILSARNMRFNIQAGGTTVDGADVICQIWYTLEAIKDTQIMELLDIL